ncbi:MAG: pirin family protein [Saccharospirillaceae bacterium]|nr:pirin family protein [Pseudomonadales bacterium]NRB80071.1 pirin family protein [Saccharospirillaceae bacterium]
MNILSSKKTHPTSDGAGVKLTRVHGFDDHFLNPFLMVDQIISDDMSEIKEGFPAHPHRGFETLTYLKQGAFSHKDSMGNTGSIQSGGAQWMSAGSGVIHSEMPEDSDSPVRGFQLWLNLPAKDKMKTPEYQDVQSDEMPWIDFNGAKVKVIGGDIDINQQTLKGPLQSLPANISVVDIELEPNTQLNIDSKNRKTMILVYKGHLQDSTKPKDSSKPQDSLRQVLLNVDPQDLVLKSADQKVELLLLVGEPINEPVAHYGPFVMNTQDEIDQAVNDYNNGTLVQEQPKINS